MGCWIQFKMRESLNLSYRIAILSLLVISQLASAKVLLVGENTFLSFEYVEATFTPIIGSSGEYGLLYAANPLDACSDLTNMADKGSNFRSAYVLIIRGGCTFEDKVRNAQKSGYKGAIVYNEGYDEPLLPRNSSGVYIHGLLVARPSGEVLRGYAGHTEMELWLIPGFGTSSWSILAITFISLFVVSAVLATIFLVRKHRRVPSLSRGGRRSSRMPRYLIQQIPNQVFTGVLDIGSTSITCAICIDDYCIGDKLRILPCQHKFHASCIDSWLGQWIAFCPVCKRDARTAKGNPPASEKTPLLSPSLSSSDSSQSLPIGIRQEPLSHATAPQPHTDQMCYTQDLTSALSQQLSYRTGPVSASQSWVRSSSISDHLLNQSESVESFSLCASATSLPGC